jgi:hypothetical protein
VNEPPLIRQTQTEQNGALKNPHQKKFGKSHLDNVYFFPEQEKSYTICFNDVSMAFPLQ